jgi:hypothetical protein
MRQWRLEPLGECPLWPLEPLGECPLVERGVENRPAGTKRDLFTSTPFLGCWVARAVAPCVDNERRRQPPRRDGMLLFDLHCQVNAGERDELPAWRETSVKPVRNSPGRDSARKKRLGGSVVLAQCLT